jgi:hypothetical protein
VQSRMDNPEALSTLSTQDIGQINNRESREAIKNGQCRDTGNIEYASHRTNKSLIFICPVSCVLNVDITSGLSIFGRPLGFL